MFSQIWCLLCAFNFAKFIKLNVVIVRDSPFMEFTDEVISNFPKVFLKTTNDYGRMSQIVQDKSNLWKTIKKKKLYISICNFFLKKRSI